MFFVCQFTYIVCCRLIDFLDQKFVRVSLIASHAIRDSVNMAALGLKSILHSLSLFNVDEGNGYYHVVLLWIFVAAGHDIIGTQTS